MKKKQKVLLLMAATALGSVLCGGVSLNQSVRAQNAETFAMEKGASVRISTDKAQAGIVKSTTTELSYISTALFCVY